MQTKWKRRAIIASPIVLIVSEFFFMKNRIEAADALAKETLKTATAKLNSEDMGKTAQKQAIQKLKIIEVKLDPSIEKQMSDSEKRDFLDFRKTPVPVFEKKGLLLSIIGQIKYFPKAEGVKTALILDENETLKQRHEITDVLAKNLPKETRRRVVLSRNVLDEQRAFNLLSRMSAVSSRFQFKDKFGYNYVRLIKGANTVGIERETPTTEREKDYFRIENLGVYEIRIEKIIFAMEREAKKDIADFANLEKELAKGADKVKELKQKREEIIGKTKGVNGKLYQTALGETEKTITNRYNKAVIAYAKVKEAKLKAEVEKKVKKWAKEKEKAAKAMKKEEKVPEKKEVKEIKKVKPKKVEVKKVEVTPAVKEAGKDAKKFIKYFVPATKKAVGNWGFKKISKIYQEILRKSGSIEKKYLGYTFALGEAIAENEGFSYMKKNMARLKGRNKLNYIRQQIRNTLNKIKGLREKARLEKEAKKRAKALAKAKEAEKKKEAKKAAKKEKVPKVKKVKVKEKKVKKPKVLEVKALTLMDSINTVKEFSKSKEKEKPIRVKVTKGELKDLKLILKQYGLKFEMKWVGKEEEYLIYTLKLKKRT